MKKALFVSFLAVLLIALFSFSAVSFADDTSNAAASTGTSSTPTAGATGSTSSADTTNVGVFTVGQDQYTINDTAASMDAAPVISQGRVLIPLRYLAYAMGLTADDVEWNSDDSSATISGINDDQQTVVTLTVGSQEMDTQTQPLQVTASDGSSLSQAPVNIQMDAAPQIINGRVFLPARWVAQAFNGLVTWDSQAQTITVNSNVTSPYAKWSTATAADKSYTASLPDGTVVPINMSMNLGPSLNMVISMEADQCGHVVYMVGDFKYPFSVPSQQAMNSINQQPGIISTSNILLSGLSAEEIQKTDPENSQDTDLMCYCVSGESGWICGVVYPKGAGIPAGASQLLDSFKIASDPDGQTTAQLPSVN
jgi:hypothetical protein